jgi:BMFP domain-containing protein YqiC
MTPTQLILWAFAIGLAWMILISMTELDVWLKKLIGKKDRNEELTARLKALEDRVKELEQKR